MTERPDAAPPEGIEEMVTVVIRDRARRGRGCGYTPDQEKRQRTMIRRDLQAALAVPPKEPPDDNVKCLKCGWVHAAGECPDVAPPKEVMTSDEFERHVEPLVATHTFNLPPSDAAQQAEKLLALKDNWDSYGARIISKRAVDAALHLRDVLTEVPSFVPTSGGGVQLEWHSRGFDVELEIEPNGRLAHPEETAETLHSGDDSKGGLHTEDALPTSFQRGVIEGVEVRLATALREIIGDSTQGETTVRPRDWPEGYWRALAASLVRRGEIHDRFSGTPLSKQPRITMTKSYLSGRQCCNFTIADAVYKMGTASTSLHNLVVELEEDMANSPIRRVEDAPGGPDDIPRTTAKQCDHCGQVIRYRRRTKRKRRDALNSLEGDET